MTKLQANAARAVLSMILASTAAIPVQAQSETAAILLQRAAVLEDACRNGDDNDATTKTCCELEMVGLRLNSAGWCYGKKNQIGAEMRWHHCTRGSYRHNPAGFCEAKKQ